MSADDVALAYDAIASTYDQAVAGDQWMRQRLWDHFLQVFRPGQHVLDVSCGTGTDAVFLAQHEIHVTGVDVSAGMIGLAQQKITTLGLATRVETYVLDLACLSQFPAGSFDGAISSFAGLNTQPNLTEFAADVARLLRPKGRLIVHLLNRFSLWELLGCVARGRIRDAARLGNDGARTYLVGGRPIEHQLYAPEEAYRRFFEPRFHLRQAYGLGVLRPPHTMRRVPAAIVAALATTEGRLGRRRPLRSLGRFFVLDLERR